MKKENAKQNYTLKFTDWMISRRYQLPPKEGLPKDVLLDNFKEYADTAETANVYYQSWEVIEAIYGEER